MNSENEPKVGRCINTDHLLFIDFLKTSHLVLLWHVRLHRCVLFGWSDFSSGKCWCRSAHVVITLCSLPSVRTFLVLFPMLLTFLLVDKAAPAIFVCDVFKLDASAVFHCRYKNVTACVFYPKWWGNFKEFYLLHDEPDHQHSRSVIQTFLQLNI